MNSLLNSLGIPSEIQAFFCVASEPSFSYGDLQELYGEGFHFVPSTRNLWVAGSETASDVIITYSAMEAMAFITLQQQRYNIAQLAFIAIGNRLHEQQVNWIRMNYPGRRFTLVFSKDLLGRLADIKMAAGLLCKRVRLFQAQNQSEIIIKQNGVCRSIAGDRLSLHAYQKAFQLRSQIRTCKPKQSISFLDQLTHDADR